MTALERLIIELKKKPGYGITEQSVNISGYNIKQLIDALEALPASTTGLSADGSVTGGTVQTQEFTNGIQVPTISSSSDITVGVPAGQVTINTGTGFTANTTGGDITLDATGDVDIISSTTTNITSGSDMILTSTVDDIHLVANTEITQTASGDITLTSSTDILAVTTDGTIRLTPSTGWTAAVGTANKAGINSDDAIYTAGALQNLARTVVAIQNTLMNKGYFTI